MILVQHWYASPSRLDLVTSSTLWAIAERKGQWQRRLVRQGTIGLPTTAGTTSRSSIPMVTFLSLSPMLYLTSHGDRRLTVALPILKMARLPHSFQQMQLMAPLTVSTSFLMGRIR